MYKEKNLGCDEGITPAYPYVREFVFVLSSRLGGALKSSSMRNMSVSV